MSGYLRKAPDFQRHPLWLWNCTFFFIILQQQCPKLRGEEHSSDSGRSQPAWLSGCTREAGPRVNSQPGIHCFEAGGSLENSPAVSTCLMRKRTHSHLRRSWAPPAPENMCEALREPWAGLCLARSAPGLITHGVDLASLQPDGLGRGVNLQRPRKCHNHSASIKSTYSHCIDECNVRLLGLSPNLNT